MNCEDGEKGVRGRSDLIEKVETGNLRRSWVLKCGRYIDYETDVDVGFELGDKVEARYRGRDKWYPGKISRVRANGTFDVNYDDGEKEQGVSRDCILSISDAADDYRAVYSCCCGPVSQRDCTNVLTSTTLNTTLLPEI